MGSEKYIPNNNIEDIPTAGTSDTSFTNVSKETIAQWKEKIDEILYQKLTVDNIETFTDKALDDLTLLNDEIIKNSIKEPSSVSSVLEDEIYEKLDLPNINEILEKIGEVSAEIVDLRQHLETFDIDDTVFVPPEENGHTIEAGNGSGFEKRGLMPRLLTLSYILSADFDLEKEDMRITVGNLREGMVRETPYVRVEVDDLERVVYICDEEGNASYIFDTKLLNEQGLTINDIDLHDKERMKLLIAIHPGIGKRVIQTKHWRTNMSEVLSESITAEESTRTTEKKSEFISGKKEWLPYEDFEAEVRSAYDGEGDIHAWYDKEQRSHPNWPSHPRQVYSSEDGWEGLPELVGQENRLKKEWLPYEDFEVEVRSAYDGEGDIHAWYNKERRSHPNWPSNPHQRYSSEDGWEGFPELVGKKRWLSFEDFKVEVRSAYDGEGDIHVWYHQERRSHPNWPANPQQVYSSEDGWEGLPELVGQENRLKKEWLPYEAFKVEVRSAYDGEGDIQVWYHKERRSHPNWPSHPARTYFSEDSWEGFPELVGKK